MDISSRIALNSGVKMPTFGFGVWRIEKDDTRNYVLQALGAGYRMIDTAAYYGNEAGVGTAVRVSGIAREEIFVTTKLWNDDARANNQMQAFENSMSELNLDYVDLYLLHWPVENFVESWKILESIYKTGRAKSIGVCNFKEHHLEALLETAEIVPAVNQIECHPYLAQRDLIEYCTSKGIICQAWAPFCAGKAPVLEEKILTDIAKRYSKTSAQVILRWDIQRGIVPLPKSSSLRHLIENAELFDFELSKHEMDSIYSLDIDTRYGADPDSFDF